MSGRGGHNEGMVQLFHVCDPLSSQPASQISEGPVIRDVTDLMEDGRETSSTVDAGETWTRTHTSSTSSSGGSESAATPSASTSALAELDCAPIVASPLNPAEAMEPLCLLDPLDDADRCL